MNITNVVMKEVGTALSRRCVTWCTSRGVYRTVETPISYTEMRASIRFQLVKSLGVYSRGDALRDLLIRGDDTEAVGGMD